MMVGFVAIAAVAEIVLGRRDAAREPGIALFESGRRVYRVNCFECCRVKNDVLAISAAYKVHSKARTTCIHGMHAQQKDINRLCKLSDMPRCKIL
jgi:hypothetical protein